MQVKPNHVRTSGGLHALAVLGAPPDVEDACVVVLSSSSSERIAIAKSILISAGIEFYVQGEGVQDMFAWGRFPVGYNSFIGPMRVVVSVESAPDAKVLLDGLTDGNETLIAESDDDTTSDQGASLMWERAAAAAKIACVVLLLGYGMLSLVSLLMVRFAQ